MDYQKLRDLLAARKWQEADVETANVMLKVAGREKECWLDIDSIKKIPCEDLSTIDQLWVSSSYGHFGFSVQKRIWTSVGGEPGNYNPYIACKFGERVGWCVNQKWLNYSDLTFSPYSSPEGHLPFVIYPEPYFPWCIGGLLVLGFWDEEAVRQQIERQQIERQRQEEMDQWAKLWGHQWGGGYGHDNGRD